MCEDGGGRHAGEEVCWERFARYWEKKGGEGDNTIFRANGSYHRSGSLLLTPRFLLNDIDIAILARFYTGLWEWEKAHGVQVHVQYVHG